MTSTANAGGRPSRRELPRRKQGKRETECELDRGEVYSLFVGEARALNPSRDPEEAIFSVFLTLHKEKNPLKIILSEGHTFKTLAFVASSMVGGVGFECARGAQARSGIALPASGGSRLSFIRVEPLSALAGF
jgi:hypothetical protein